MAKVGRPKKFKTKQELEDRMQEYMDYLEANDKLPTMAGLAYYLGIDRQTLYNYKKDEQFFDIIKRYKEWVEMSIEEYAILHGSGATIFVMKNYGYTDKQVVDTNIRTNNGKLNDLMNELNEDETE